MNAELLQNIDAEIDLKFPGDSEPIEDATLDLMACTHMIIHRMKVRGMGVNVCPAHGTAGPKGRLATMCPMCALIKCAGKKNKLEDQLAT